MRNFSAIFVFFFSPMVLNPVNAQPVTFERCAACHSGKDTTKDLGPSLVGIIGRKAGSREDFRYSRPLARSGVTWDERSLDAFLKSPDQFIPGTRMPFEGIVSDAERGDIIRYLKTLK
ncbi:MAG: c-type cytochrome [Betaproteobacteria bacterium]|nr:c-type cytochrome [Betaproteobacteria bacterium]